MKKFNMQRTILSSSIAAVVGSVSTGAFAQGAEVEEEVVVTGIRASLDRAMDIKKETSGVVDAISAEDIGKMPDSNLAESLQRITGVSIDRVNGEGSRVTVRGFGPNFNVITMNGRQMAAANVEDGSESVNRSFDFANLAAESVSGVEVYKTGKASLTTGGIGSTINIKTARPLDNPGLQASIAGKLLHDESNINGDDVTPELSGIISSTFMDDKLGLSLSGSYSDRHSGRKVAETTGGWYAYRESEGGPAIGTLQAENDPGSFPTNRIHTMPQNLMYNFNGVQRERTNAQAVAQFAPFEELTFTLDYTYSEQDVENQRQELSFWFGAQANQPESIYRDDGYISSPLVINNTSTPDIGMGVGDYGRRNENNAIGFNAAWDVTDTLSLEFDYSHSEAEAGGKDDRGSFNTVTAVQYNRAGQTVDFTGELPVINVRWTDDAGLDPSRFISSGSFFRNGLMEAEIDQVQLKGALELDGAVRKIDFGLSVIEADNRSAFANAQRDEWGGYTSCTDTGDVGYLWDCNDDYDDSNFTRRDLLAEFDNIDGNNEQMMTPDYYDVDFEGLVADIEALEVANGTNRVLAATEDFTTDRRIKETQTAAYVEAQFGHEWDDVTLTVDLGVRYEGTEVEAPTVVPTYTGIRWQAANEFIAESDGTTAIVEEGDYNNVLPNLDVQLGFLDDELIARASTSKTMARPTYDNLQGAQTIATIVRINGGNGQAGNPDLDPFESTNFDLSLEWYYGDSSYVSLGYYKKDVENFIGQSVVNETLFNLPHPGQGPRFNQVVADNPSCTDNAGNLDLDCTRTAFIDTFGDGDALVGDRDLGDPDAVFGIVTPVNEREASIDGFEIALQHVFGDSGFGGIINYTTVDGDIEYDNDNTNADAQQFALLGLSDSFNIVGFYENYGFQARIAYNWRDDFLNATVLGNGQLGPIYVEEYGQVDFNVSYDILDNLTVFLEGINVTDEVQRNFSRTDSETYFVSQTGARYALGASYKF